MVIKNTAILIREISKHTMELCQLILNAGGVAALIDYLGNTRGNVRLPGIMALGYIAAHSETLAMAVIVSRVSNTNFGESTISMNRQFRCTANFGESNDSNCF